MNKERESVSCTTLSPMAMGKRRGDRQPQMWLAVTDLPTAVADALLFVALFLQGLAAGIENSNEMGYWAALTPDELLGRMNATRRSVNRTMAALGALIAGLMAGLIGDRSPGRLTVGRSWERGSRAA